MNKGNFFATLKLYLVSRCLAERSGLGEDYWRLERFKFNGDWIGMGLNFFFQKEGIMRYKQHMWGMISIMKTMWQGNTLAHIHRMSYPLEFSIQLYKDFGKKIL